MSRHVTVDKCDYCLFYDGWPFRHRDECRLDIGTIPKLGKVPEACPLRKGKITIGLRGES